MTIDHSEFIEKYHRTTDREQFLEKKSRFRWHVPVLFAVLCAAWVVLGLFVLDYPFVYVAKGLLIAVVVGAAVSAVAYVVHVIRKKRKHDSLIYEVLEGSRGARLITDAADNTVYCNQKFERLCIKIGAPSLVSLSKLFDKDEEARAHFRFLADQAFRGLTDSIEIESRFEEHPVWYQVTAQPIAGWAGYVHWRIDDITERHAIERAVRDEREKLIDFTDNAPVGFFSVDEKGRFVFVNATLARWLGDDIRTIMQTRTLHTYFENVPENANPYDVIENGGAKQIAEVVMKGHGGRTFTASISQAVVHEGNGIVRTRGVLHDMTAEREMYQALKMSEDRFQRFFEEAPLGIAIVNQKGVINDFNPAFSKLIGYDMKELAEKPLKDLLPEDVREKTIRALDTIEFDDRRSMTPIEVRMIAKEGHEVTVQMYARRIEGQDKHLALHFIDLTDQKALEAQFVQSQKMQAIGQLAGGVAHDFNNLLTAMIGFCDLLLLRHKPGDPSFSDIMQIKQNSNRAANLVRQLLAFSRQQTLRPRVHDVSDILSEVSHLLRRLIGASIELEVLHGQDAGLIKVDMGQIEQVLMNLAVNARDAMDGSGHLKIETGLLKNDGPFDLGSGDTMPPGEWVSIAVTDTGCGITDENLGRIFEPFFTTKEVGQGTGLGLATVYGIVRQTGGYLGGESVVGQGTTFTIYLPTASEEDDSESDAKDVKDEAQDLTGTARILLVEDEDAVRTFSSRALSNKGYEVMDANGGESALDILKTEDIHSLDLLVTDVIMPDMDGPTLAAKMREENPDLKIIFMSGYTEEKLKDHMGENIWFLAKPFTLKQLAAKVKEVLDT